MRKKLIAIAALAGLLASCGPSKSYTGYLETLEKLNANRQSPGIQQTFDSDGRLLSQTITLPQNPIMPQQEQPSEWASVFRTALSIGLPVAGVVWNTYASGEAYSKVAGAVHGTGTLRPAARSITSASTHPATALTTPNVSSSLALVGVTAPLYAAGARFGERPRTPPQRRPRCDRRGVRNPDRPVPRGSSRTPAVPPVDAAASVPDRH